MSIVCSCKKSIVLTREQREEILRNEIEIPCTCGRILVIGSEKNKTMTDEEGTNCYQTYMYIK